MITKVRMSTKVGLFKHEKNEQLEAQMLKFSYHYSTYPVDPTKLIFRIR